MSYIHIKKISEMHIENKIHIQDNSFWDAQYHSFDQRNENIYYVITLYHKEGDDFIPFKRFGAWFPEYEIKGVADYEGTVKALAPIAKSGKTNIPSKIFWKGLGQDDIDQL